MPAGFHCFKKRLFISASAKKILIKSFYLLFSSGQLPRLHGNWQNYYEIKSIGITF